MCYLWVCYGRKQVCYAPNLVCYSTNPEPVPCGSLCFPLWSVCYLWVCYGRKQVCYATNPVCYSTNPEPVRGGSLCFPLWSVCYLWVCYVSNPVCYTTNPVCYGKSLLFYKSRTFARGLKGVIVIQAFMAGTSTKRSFTALVICLSSLILFYIKSIINVISKVMPILHLMNGSQTI